MPKQWNAQAAKPFTWYTHPLASCVSANGKPYSITLKKGTANKLIVNFLGGGLSWNEETAQRPFSISAAIRKKDWYYIEHISKLMQRVMHAGVLAANDAKNPFNQWHVLNIPYCTGDFHIGNNDFQYSTDTGQAKTLHHQGARNIEAALLVCKQFFPETPDTLLIMGQSAGGFGCVAHAPTIQDLYPDCKNTVVYVDGSHLYAPIWERVAEEVWKVEKRLATYIKSEDLMFDLFRFAKGHMSDNTIFLQSTSVWDVALVEFMHKMNSGKKEINPEALEHFHKTLQNTIAKCKGEMPNYHYYLTDYARKKDGTTPHIFVGSPKLFYDKLEDGVSVANWLQDAVNQSPKDVGQRFLDKQ